VAKDVVTLLPFTHCTTEHGRKLVAFVGPGLAVMESVNAGLPARAVVGETEFDARAGGVKFAAGLAMANCNTFDAPDELETLTLAGLEEAVSIGRMVAVT
jgi:hypothetical protein